MPDQYHDPGWRLSQRTLVALWQALTAASHDFRSDLLYASDFPDWFVRHSEAHYSFDWQEIIRDLRSRRFFYPGSCDQMSNITGEFLDDRDASALGELLIQRLAVLLVTTFGKSEHGELVRRRLELDGYNVDRKQLQLIRSKGQSARSRRKNYSLLLFARPVSRTKPPS